MSREIKKRERGLSFRKQPAKRDAIKKVSFGWEGRRGGKKKSSRGWSVIEGGRSGKLTSLKRISGGKIFRVLRKYTTKETRRTSKEKKGTDRLANANDAALAVVGNENVVAHILKKKNRGSTEAGAYPRGEARKKRTKEGRRKEF